MTYYEKTSTGLVRDALIHRLGRVSMKEVADKANVPYGWLQQFYYGNIIEPGYIKMTKLARYLKVDLTALE